MVDVNTMKKNIKPVHVEVLKDWHGVADMDVTSQPKGKKSKGMGRDQ